MIYCPTKVEQVNGMEGKRKIWEEILGHPKEILWYPPFLGGNLEEEFRDRFWEKNLGEKNLGHPPF